MGLVHPHQPVALVVCKVRHLVRSAPARTYISFYADDSVHVHYMSSEVEPCVVWALRVSLPFLAKLIITGVVDQLGKEPCVVWVVGAEGFASFPCNTHAQILGCERPSKLVY